MKPPSRERFEAALRRGSDHHPGPSAAAWLLIEHGAWTVREDFARVVTIRRSPQGRVAVVNWSAFATTAASSDASASDVAVALTACALAGFGKDPLDGPPPGFSTRQWVMERDSRTCVYCGAPADTLDHVIPKSRGGRSVCANLVAACEPCNGTKADRTPDELGWVIHRPGWGSDRITAEVDARSARLIEEAKQRRVTGLAELNASLRDGLAAVVEALGLPASRDQWDTRDRGLLRALAGFLTSETNAAAPAISAVGLEVAA